VSETAERNKRNRRAGQRWQATLREGFRGAGLDAEELKLAGREDEGDLVIRQPPTSGEPGRFVVIEAKAGALKPAEFVTEAAIEGQHFAAHRGLPADRVTAVAVVKRRGASWRHAYVLTTVGDYFGLDGEAA